MVILQNHKYTEADGANRITFFTPSYNRSQYLHRIEQILLSQSIKMFLWILVNDGSQDDTDIVGRGILNKDEIPMMYISKENGGKHSAFKVALENCKTTYFQCMDDDDLYSEYSVEFFINKWKQIKNENREEIGAIRVLTKKHDGSIMANFKIKESEMGNEFDATTLEMNLINNKRMENWTCYNTLKLKTIDLFPSNYWLCEQHKLFGEGIWQSRFARKYKCRYVFIVLREYNSDDIESLIRGEMTPQKKMDAFINSHMNLNEQWDYVKKSVRTMVRALIACNVKRMNAGVVLSNQLKHCKSKSLKLMLVIFLPLAFAYKMVKR